MTNCAHTFITEFCVAQIQKKKREKKREHHFQMIRKKIVVMANGRHMD